MGCCQHAAGWLRRYAHVTRPLPVTVVGWVIIAISVEGLISLLGGLVTPLFTSGTVQIPFSVPVALWVSAVTLFVNLVLAALILAGFGWARIVYVAILAYALLGLLVGRQPISLAVIAGAKLVVFGYFFFRRESNQYFAKCAASAA